MTHRGPSGRHLMRTQVSKELQQRRTDSKGESEGSSFKRLACGDTFESPFLSGPQNGPAEKGHIKKRQKVSKIFSTLFDIFAQGQKTSKIVKKCHIYFDFLDNVRAGSVFRPILGSDFVTFILLEFWALQGDSGITRLLSAFFRPSFL